MNSLFEALYFLQKDSFYKKIYYASRAFSSLVTAQIVVSSQYPWNPSLTTWAQNILLWLSIPVQNVSASQYSWALAFTVAVIFVCAGLYSYVCYQIIAGTMSNHRVTKILRFLLGILMTLSNPVFNVLLASVNCDWIGGTNLSLNWDMSENCPTHTSRIILMTVSTVTFVPFIALVALSSVMHVSDPRSPMILSRAHSRVDLLSVMTDTISNTLSVFLIGYDRLFATIYVVLQLSVVVCFVVFQPYYHTFSNDLFTMFSAQTLWAGIAFAVLAITNDGTVASIVLFGGALPFGILSFWVSSYWRAQVISQALQEYDSRPDEPVDVELADDEVFPVLQEKYDRNATTFFMTDVKAALVEIRTRFLLRDDSPRAIAIAENIYKNGMLQYPQSVYLRLQYVTFLLYYRNDPNLASLRLQEISGMEIDLDMRFSLLRKKREVERKRHVGSMGNGALGMDSISFEEVKTRIKDVRGLHKKAIELTGQLWKTLARKLGGGIKGRKGRKQARRLMRQALSRRVHPAQDEDEEEMSGVAPGGESGLGTPPVAAASKEEILLAIAPLVEELQRVTDQADSEYALLWAQCGDSKEVGSEYARYLRHIKKDSAAAEEIEDRLQLNGGRGGGGSQADNSSRDGGSSVGNSSLTLEQQQHRQRISGLTKTFLERVSGMKMRLRAATFLLVAASICSFVVFYLLSSWAVPVFVSLFESGFERFSCTISAFELRQMHIAAMQGNGATFNSSRRYLNTSMLNARELHYGLATTYRTDFALRNDYLSEQTVDIRRVGSANTVVKEKISPNELMMRIIDFSLEALSQPMSKFASTTRATLTTFPQYFFVLENSFECTRAMDTVGETYRLELDQMLGYASATLIAMFVVIVSVEFGTVVMLLRPAVNRAFDELSLCVMRFTGVPLDTSKELASLESKQLSRFRVLAGDDNDQSSVLMDPDDGLSPRPDRYESRHSSPRRVRVDLSPRNSVGFMSPREDVGVSPSTAFRARFGSDSSKLNFAAEGPIVSPVTTPKKENTGQIGDLFVERIGSVMEIDVTDQRDSSSQDPYNGIDHERQEMNSGSKGGSSSSHLLFVEPSAGASPRARKGYSRVDTHEQEDRSRRNSNSSVRTSGEEEGEEVEAPPQSAGVFDRLWAMIRRLTSSQVGTKVTSKRKMPIVLTYVIMLLVICGCITAVTVLGQEAISNILTASPSIINSNRRQFLFMMCFFNGGEIFYGASPFSLIGSQLSSWDIPSLLCRILSTSSLGLMTHYGVLYGTNEGFYVYPEARKLSSLDAIINSDCSPMSRNTDQFLDSIQMSGLALDPLFSSFYFVPQCPTTNDFGPNSIQMTDPRIYRFTKTLTSNGCPLYKSGQSTSGFHRLVDASFNSLQAIAKANLSSPVESAALVSNAAQVIVLSDPETDLVLGLLKVSLIALGHSINLIATNQSIMAAVFAVIMSMIILQYAVLGRRIQKLMKNNLSITLTCERMLESAVAVMKKQGYTTSKIRKLVMETLNEAEERDEIHNEAMQSLPDEGDSRSTEPLLSPDNMVEPLLISRSAREGPILMDVQPPTPN